MDEIDRASEQEEVLTTHAVRAVRARATLPAGQAGDCDLCGEWSARLVGGVCAPCRDKYRLP
jgi:hypothetical protein